MSALAATTAAGNAELVAFVILAPVAVLAALAMVFNRNAVYAALLLVVNFFCLAVFYVFLQAQFMAAVQVIVYAGAIMILFLFVLMLLGVRRDDRLSDKVRAQSAVAFTLGAVLLAGIVAVVATGVFPDGAAGLAAANEGGNVEALGRLLFTRYTLAFEATGVLLLVAGVGALVLARRAPGGDSEARQRARQRPPEPREDLGDEGAADEEPLAAAVAADGVAASANGHHTEPAAGPAADNVTPRAADDATPAAAAGTGPDEGADEGADAAPGAAAEVGDRRPA